MNGRRPAALLAAAALLMGVSLAQAQTSPAQDYPNRAVTLVVPYPAGGGLDALARMLGQKLAERLGKPVVIENRTGAGTVIGAASVAKAAPDGYTIMLGTSTPFAITATLNKSLPYDPAKDFAPIALVSNAPFLLLVHPSQPVHSVADLIALAKAKPGQLSYGSAGPGSPQNLSFELLKTLTGINIVHVPYRGDGPALTDLVAGHIPTMFGEPTPILPLLKDGKVRALGVSSASRLPIAPDVPTIAEAGVPGFDLTSWQMIVAPAGTPQEIVDKLHVEVKKVLELPEVKAEFARTARITVDYPSVDDLQRFMRSEIVRLGKVVEHAGIARSQ
ncbi:MAG TPA: tripartite tricarboxylate transporter substrate binding protein [Xanthobacteraceae bacterium]|jgi:tripartite-type tricarboxylate transporter receptor subunit TctC|nr:tripartite tricarboxylate transporter substrate binding protein [Xanthobacteraceae bacterium]